jgi:hypothetical protein
MERMDMHSRNEYLKVLRERYLKAKTKKEKSRILDEYCLNTGQARKYAIRKIQPNVSLNPKPRRGEEKSTMVNLKQLWLKFGRSLITLVGRGLSPF